MIRYIYSFVLFIAICSCEKKQEVKHTTNSDVNSIAEEVSGRYFGTASSLMYDSLPNPYIVDAIVSNDTGIVIIGLPIDSIYLSLFEFPENILGENEHLEYFSYDRDLKGITMSFSGFIVFDYTGYRRD